MKTLKILSLFLILFTAVNFTACGDVEPIDPTIVINPPVPVPDPDCLAPSSFQASDFINNTNVNLSWVSVGDETSWEIQYGAENFTVGSGTSAISTNTNFTVTGLNSSNTYDFYVRSLCGVGIFSEWTGPVR